MLLRAIISFFFAWLFFRLLDQVFGLGTRQSKGGPSSTQRGQHNRRRDPRASERSRHIEALKVLELPPSADDEQVRAAYLDLARKYHPDRVEHLGPELVELTGEKFKEIQEAYEQIIGPNRH